MLQALGFEFLDKNGVQVAHGANGVAELCAICEEHVMPELKDCTFKVACDVTNPLCGEYGCSAVYGPQKGADTEMIAKMDRWLGAYAKLTRELHGVDFSEHPGAGAAGGLGGGFKALLNAKLVPGIKMILEAIKFDQIIAGSSLVVTGEGCIDYQTLMGKTPGGVLQAASQQDTPVVAIGGKVLWCDELKNSNFAAIIPATPDDMSLEEAMLPEVAKENVRKTAVRMAQLFNLQKDNK
jgi:glycerate kinase